MIASGPSSVDGDTPLGVEEDDCPDEVDVMSFLETTSFHTGAPHGPDAGNGSSNDTPKNNTIPTLLPPVPRFVPM